MTALTLSRVLSAIATAALLPARRTCRRYPRSSMRSARAARTARNRSLIASVARRLSCDGAASADLLRYAQWVGAFTECGEQDEVGDLGPVFGVVGDASLGIGLGRLDQACGLVRRCSDGDRVAAALHLSPIRPEQRRRITEDRLGFDEHGRGGGVAVVEPPRQRSRLLDVRELVGANRNECRPAEENVGGLVNGVCEHQSVECTPAGACGLLLDCRVAQQLGEGDETEERQHATG